MQQQLETAKSLADYLGVSLAKVRKDCRTTDIPRVKIGRSVRFDRTEVLLWLRAKGASQGIAEVSGGNCK